MSDWKRVFAALLSMALVACLFAICLPFYKIAYVTYCYGQISRGKNISRNYQRISRYPEQAFDLARGKVRSRQARQQIIALCILRQIGDQRSTELLGRALNDGVEPETTVSCLCAIGTPQAIGCLTDSLESPLQEVRQHSYGALIEVLRGDKQHDMIFRALSVRDANVQISAFNHLAGLSNDQLECYRESLSSIFKDGDSAIQRGYAARMLAKLGDKDGMLYCMNGIRCLLATGSASKAESAAAELETLSALCGRMIIPEVISVAKEFPEDRRGALLSGLYFLTKQEFKSLGELEEWWKENEHADSNQD